MKYRIDIDKYELEALLNIVNGKGHVSEPVKATLLEKILNPKQIKSSNKKTIAAYEATKIRTSKAKVKIENAINLLRMENKKITHYSISKTSNVSFNTVKKYISSDTLISLNEIN